jgi:hypothetical protein
MFNLVIYPYYKVYFLGFLSFFKKLLMYCAQNNLILQELDQIFFDNLVTPMGLVFSLSHTHKYMRM